MNSMEEKITIKVTIGDRPYQFSIDRNLEPMLRTAVQNIGDKMVSIRKKYACKDAQDPLAMILLQYVIKVIQYQQADPSSTIVREINSLDSQLDEYIKNNL